MKKPVLALALVAAVSCWAVASAQDAPLRGVGLLALNVAGESDNGLGSAQVNRNALVETADEGGGGGPRNVRGSGDVGPAPNRNATEALPKSPDALPPATIQRGDPAVPSVTTPKRPSYRWQSLVPGAIK